MEQRKCDLRLKLYSGSLQMIKLPLLVGLLMTMNNVNSGMAVVHSPVRSAAAVMTYNEARFVELTNKERVQRGLSHLEVDPLLVEIARAHSKEMSDKHYFSHHSPTPGIETPLDRYLASVTWRPSWALVGENLFYCSIVDVDRGHTAFMNSPTHKSNVIEPRYDHIGVGIYVDARGEFWVTEMFLTKKD